MQIRYRCQHCYREFEGPEDTTTCEVCRNHGGLFEIGRTEEAEAAVETPVPAAVPAAPLDEEPKPAAKKA